MNQLDQNSCTPFRPSSQITSCAQQGQYMIECGQGCQDKPKKSGKSRAVKCQKKKEKGKCNRKKVAKKCKLTCGKCQS